MSENVESVTRELLGTLSGLERQFEQLAQKCEQGSKNAEQLAEEVDKQSAALQQSASESVEWTAAQGQKLQSKAEPASKGLSHCAQAVAGQAERAEAALAKDLEAIRQARDQLKSRIAQVTALKERWAEASQALAQRAQEAHAPVESQLQSLTSTIEQELVPPLRERTARLAERRSLLAAVLTRCQEDLLARGDQFFAQLAEHGEAMKEKFAWADQQIETEVVTAPLTAQLDQVETRAADNVKQLGQVVEDLTTDLTACWGRLNRALDLLTRYAGHENQSLGQITQKQQGLAGIFASFLG